MRASRAAANHASAPSGFARINAGAKPHSYANAYAGSDSQRKNTNSSASGC